ncbi:MAG: hypothetical protein K2G75_05510, partial [Muribaculaceae bacterium]|nr:hypothetical protein [Muribaculaceae bacterium]
GVFTKISEVHDGIDIIGRIGVVNLFILWGIGVQGLFFLHIAIVRTRGVLNVCKPSLAREFSAGDRWLSAAGLTGEILPFAAAAPGGSEIYCKVNTYCRISQESAMSAGLKASR